MIKGSTLLILSFVLLSCASTSELSSLSPCERVEFLSKRIGEYEEAKDQVSSNSPTDQGTRVERQRWVRKINDAHVSSNFIKGFL